MFGTLITLLISIAVFLVVVTYKTGKSIFDK